MASNKALIFDIQAFLTGGVSNRKQGLLQLRGGKLIEGGTFTRVSHDVEPNESYTFTGTASNSITIVSVTSKLDMTVDSRVDADSPTQTTEAIVETAVVFNNEVTSITLTNNQSSPSSLIICQG